MSFILPHKVIFSSSVITRVARRHFDVKHWLFASTSNSHRICIEKAQKNYKKALELWRGNPGNSASTNNPVHNITLRYGLLNFSAKIESSLKASTFHLAPLVFCARVWRLSWWRKGCSDWRASSNNAISRTESYLLRSYISLHSGINLTILCISGHLAQERLSLNKSFGWFYGKICRKI